MLKIVSNRLAPLVIKEYTSIMGVKKDLQELQTLVEEINYWLESTGDKTMGSGPPLRWLKLLKDVTYDVDDIIDEFHLEAEKHETDGDIGKHIISKYLCRKPTSLLLQCKTAHKIRAIKNRLAAIVRQRSNVSAIVNSLPVGHSIRHIVKTTGETASLPIVDATSVIGRDQEKQQIISKLLETQGQQKLKIVSIIGLGGSDFMVHLKSGAPGSRILITARSRKVAETVGSSDQFVLPFLSPDDSWQLFQQSLVIPAKGLELEYVEVGKEIVRKCGGIPLAIKALAGVLYAIHVLPEWLGELRCLQKMIIKSCDSLSRLPQSMGYLTCLQVLRIEWCDALDQLPECLGQLCSLRKFVIQHLRSLTGLPQSMCRLNSLEQLVIHDCPGIKSLPEGIKDLTALQQVDISCCPDLGRRCKREKGEDWHLISHISHLVIC
ncbi:hypothetical protein PR202_ga04152 [Eleusine coracana subsp. coracana]|uniref:Uncharacterized protein n=1 Tax=Eleusine coracana subsp. coracana TaxID=191504 RepID=A0AAV5BP53_ELECO|nr:hypothetical protein PR202_ga04152 [Eleusine coracana subsp. coracana]